MSNARGNTIAGAVGGNYLLVAGDTFTKTVFAPTSAGVSVNSDSESRRDSNNCWKNTVVRIAEHDTVINDLKETWRHLVKLHNLPWNAIHHRGEDQGQKLKPLCSGGSGSGSRKPSN